MPFDPKPWWLVGLAERIRYRGANFAAPMGGARGLSRALHVQLRASAVVQRFLGDQTRLCVNVWQEVGRPCAYVWSNDMLACANIWQSAWSMCADVWQICSTIFSPFVYF